MTTLTVNHEQRDTTAPLDTPLLDALRDDLGLKGTKGECRSGHCGACTVLVDGAPVLACTTRLGDLGGRAVLTIEGLTPAGEPLHPVQQAFLDAHVPQCGWCTGGQVLRVAALLAHTPEPSDDLIVDTLDPVLCRCGTYPRARRAARLAAERRPERA